MMIEGFDGQMVDESNAIKAAQLLDQFYPVHDWRTCDCSAKADRLWELIQQKDMTEFERIEAERISKELSESFVLI